MNRTETTLAPLADRVDRAVAAVQSWAEGWRGALQFPLGWLTRPAEVASLVPSSKSLLRQLTREVQQNQPRSIIELGPGTGNTSQALLDGLDLQGKLMAVEIVPEFVQQLRELDDPRLIAVESDASDLQELVAQHRLEKVDMIVSGIPFSHIDPAAAKDLVRSIEAILEPGGIFLAYQFRDAVSEYAGDVFGEAKVSFVWRNFPPLRIYRWTKAPAPACSRQVDPPTVRQAACVT